MGTLIKCGRKRSFLLTNPHPQNNHTEFRQLSCNNFPSQSRTRLHSKRDTDAGQLPDEQHGLRLLHVGNDIFFSIFHVRKAWGGVSSRPIVSRTSTTLIRRKWIEEAKPRLTNFPRRSYAAKEIHNSFRDIQERGSRLLRQALPPSGI